MRAEKKKKKLYGEEAVEKAALEIWDNPAPGRDYEIDIHFPEFTCLCPRSGYPDFAVIKVLYVPDKKIVELKSLKLWLNSFRGVHISHEEAVVGDFNPRGNVKTLIKVSTESPLTGKPTEQPL
jgi:7-cyano-7-deazaguanine reductase